MLPQELGCGTGMSCWRYLRQWQEQGRTPRIAGKKTRNTTSLPQIRGKRGRPCRRPKIVQGDCGYDSEPHRCQLRARSIVPLIRKRGTEHGSGLGSYRWVVDRPLSWLHQFHRLRVRYERRDDIHEALLVLGCIMICWSALVSWNLFC